MVSFSDGTSAEIDHIILCTGYHISMPYLADNVRAKVLDESTNVIKVTVQCSNWWKLSIATKGLVARNIYYAWKFVKRPY